MSALTDYTEKPETKTSLKSSLKRMRSMWLRGPVNRFDLKLAKILDCSLEEAAKTRESWEIMGFLCYDSRGLLTWRAGGF